MLLCTITAVIYPLTYASRVVLQKRGKETGSEPSSFVAPFPGVDRREGGLQPASSARCAHCPYYLPFPLHSTLLAPPTSHIPSSVPAQKKEIMEPNGGFKEQLGRIISFSSGIDIIRRWSIRRWSPRMIHAKYCELDNGDCTANVSSLEYIVHSSTRRASSCVRTLSVLAVNTTIMCSRLSAQIHTNTTATWRLIYRARSSWEEDDVVDDGKARVATVAHLASRARHTHGRRATGQHLPHLQAGQERPRRVRARGYMGEAGGAVQAQFAIERGQLEDESDTEAEGYSAEHDGRDEGEHGVR